ncbi:hypothetical protein BAUCODRAFT_150179 [Baudoinia panamericana UAMH 10762]|uniref:Ketoreductase (KR) domain-containing protein n=1 Tax=Baudoinia panamericana (strain UAMH 10762) TaxID=717646 RepID=M2N5A6_BAUPA|nr:uncharacterized protein BAUCODRAFT_150179 [Baudoinia panamericana UAMH 10762]EMC93945.1 hypothetical protein BAUCODRAFT_150179 [Baudoinia panamericana UAMH 10762]
MVTIEAVREANAKGNQLHDLVAIFVGGTGGIGESTAKEFFRHTVRPVAYIIGRSEEKGNNICEELREINADGKAIFLQKDVSLIRNVDEVSEELKRRERRIHCLFLTAGYMSLSGRNETEEGIDRKMSVNYYSRIRWMMNLMPALEEASRRNELARVITVLAAGSEGDIRLDDLELKHNFTLHACLAHSVVMTDFMIEELARRHPGVAFSHSYPGTVKTGIANQLTGPVRLAVKVMYAVMTPWILDVKESGERHFFQMTNQCYPSRNGSVGIPPPPGIQTMKGSDGEVGSGAYLLDWDGKSTGDEAVLRKYRELGMLNKVVDHTTQIFEQAERRNRKDSKRPAAEQLQSGRSVPDPIGWRSG